ncbi:MAG TPA: glucosidase, partial [Chloroflexota bacterium]
MFRSGDIRSAGKASVALKRREKEQHKPMTAEGQRLNHDGAAWRLWGPYISDRAWGTVREDYSADGDAWGYFTHDQARSRTYRWSEDGVAGICDEGQHLCFALTLWNGRDAILKERFFGLTNPEGNHGEDVKEYYYYLDSTPTHSYMRMLYKYPQADFPYSELVEINARRTREDPEYELVDTGIFGDDRYFDVFVEYAKAVPDDILIRVSAVNRGPDSVDLHLLPTLWCRNTWTWEAHSPRPRLRSGGHLNGETPLVRAEHPTLGPYVLFCEGADGLLFTENETNLERLYGAPNRTPYVKDAFHEYLVAGDREAVNPQAEGTKAAAHYRRLVDPGETLTLRLRLTARDSDSPFADFDEIFAARQREADEFYLATAPAGLDEDRREVQRQALASMLWSKQFYKYDVARWLAGDPTQPPPPRLRLEGRNSRWSTLDAHDVLSMPDKWEYPWFAAWDLAFQCLSLALVDVDFAKCQIQLLLEDRFQHPNGAVPAYEWNFSDVNPPILAGAALRVCQLEQEQRGALDTGFLERVFQKLMLYFTWWINREDADGRNLFEGGFLGMDNIGVFDRDALPAGFQLEQADGTSWMAVFCQNMLRTALELAKQDHAYEGIASTFFERFLFIAGAVNNLGGQNISLWDEEDQFFYDVLRLPDGTHEQLKVRSLVGLTALFTAINVEAADLDRFPDFRRRTDEFLARRPDLAQLIPVGQWQ